MKIVSNLVFLLLSIPYFILHSQNPILLVNADSIVGYRVNDSPVRDFVGNVHLRQGNVDLYCNRATHYIVENKAILIGSVKITQDTLILLSEHIEYDGNKLLATSSSKVEIKDPQNYLKANYGQYNFKTKVANFFENVVFEEKEARLISQKLDFNRTSQQIYAFGDVKLETDSVIIFCDTLVYSKSDNVLLANSNVKTIAKFEGIEILSGKLFLDRKSKFSKSFEDPRLIIIDTIRVENDTIETKLDTLSLFADTLISKSKDGETFFLFVNNVKLLKNEIIAIGNYGVFYREEEAGFLVGSPFLWYDSTEFSGDSLFFLFKDKKISSLKFIGRAEILSPSNIDSSYINKIQADTIEVYFNDNKVDFVFGIGNTKTNYFLKNEETNEIQLANYLSERIKINFFENEVDNVIWLGNVSGEVIPKIIFEKNLEKYYSYPQNYLKLKPQKVF